MLHGITAESNPELHKKLAGYSASVWIYFDSPDGLLGSNGNGKGEVEPVDINVTLHWNDLKGGEHSMDYWSAVTHDQYEPYSAP